jgi:hypothetical protein
MKPKPQDQIIQIIAQELHTLVEQNLTLAEKIRLIDHQLKTLRDITAGLDKPVKKTTWLTSGDLAAELKISPVKVRELFRTGRIRGYKLDPDNADSHIRFDRSEVYEDLKCIQ